MSDTTTLIERLATEADQCRNDGADDIAKLLDEAVAELQSLGVQAYAGQVGQKPLTDEQITQGYCNCEISAAPASLWFSFGARFAELHHGITA